VEVADPMIVILGFAMIAVFMYLILSKRAAPVIALILVPAVFAIIAVVLGAAVVPEGGVAGAIMEEIKSFAPTAALLFFAIIYFGLMIDVGLFDPLIRFILRVVGNSPVRLVVGTAVLAGMVSLDGDGSTTFIITVSALLPVYLTLGLSPVVLTTVACLANGVLNIVPWGGPTVRAATVLKVPPNELFVPMVPSMIAAIGVVLLFAVLMGRSESRRLKAAGVTIGAWTSPAHPGGSAEAELDYEERNPDMVSGLDPQRDTLRPNLIWFNLALTVILLVLLVADVLPLPLLFMGAAAIAIPVNFPDHVDQSERIKAHGASIVSVVAMVFAAAVLVGVLQGTGMIAAMANAIVNVVPPGVGHWFAVITGLLSMPLTFFMSNDAFYFGVLPILSEAAGEYGITPVEMARAAIIGQPVHLTSPLVPAMLLLISLARVELADFHRKTIWRAVVCALVMLAVAIAIGVVPA
jgi:CitMHS family citrate-Mg2+:H+ or citrate-Ca2+:H+ symporter